MRLLVASSALVLLLAGCLGPGSPTLSATDVDVPGEAPALLHLSAARAAAATWHAEARLVGITATEGESIGDHVDPPLFWNTAADPAVGNGLALVWTYVFAGPEDGVLYYVSIGADGGSLYANELPVPYYWAVAEPVAARPDGHSVKHMEASSSPAPSPPPGPATVPTPTIDSAAAFAAANVNPDFAGFAALHPRHEVLIQLAGDGDRPVWLLAKRTATYFGAMAAVDGKTGELLHFSSWPSPPTPCGDCPPPPPPPPPEPRPEDFEATWSSAAPGRLSTGGYSGTTVSTTFEVVSQHWFRDAAVHLVADTLPGEWIAVRILDPSGHPVWEASGSSVVDAVVPWAMPGKYTVEVRGDGPTLRDIPFESTIRVRYDEPGWRSLYTQMGQLTTFGTPLDMPFPVEHDASLLEIAVGFGQSLPTDGIRYRLEGPDGIVEEGTSDVADMTLTVELPEPGAWRLTVWPQPQVVKPLEVSVVAQVEHVQHEPCCWM